MHIGTYDVTLRVTLDDYSISKDFTFQITVNACVVTGITPSSVVANEEYLIGQAAVTFQLSSFSYQPDCGYTFSYSLAEQGQSQLPGGVSFNSDTLVGTLDSTDNGHAGTFVLELTGTLNDALPSSLTVALITVTLHDPNVYCLSDQVVFGSANAGLLDEYTYNFEQGA